MLCTMCAGRRCASRGMRCALGCAPPRRAAPHPAACAKHRPLTIRVACIHALRILHSHTRNRKRAPAVSCSCARLVRRSPHIIAPAFAPHHRCRRAGSFRVSDFIGIWVCFWTEASFKLMARALGTLLLLTDGQAAEASSLHADLALAAADCCPHPHR